MAQRRAVGRAPTRGRVEGREARKVGPRRSKRRGLRRYAVVYDIDGPRVRLGIAWFVLAVTALVLGPLVTAVVFGAAAAVAAAQTAKVWRSHGRRPHLQGAALGAAALPLGATFGSGGLGVAILGLVAASWLLTSADRGPSRSPIMGAAATLQSALFPGLAAACVVLVLRLEIGAAVSLFLLVSGYEIGDYLVGSGSKNPYEGPAAGIAATIVLTFTISALGVPPFDFAGAWEFGALTALLCPLGQLFASAVLPSAKAPASGLRRLDSLLLSAPAWAWLAGIYITNHPA